MTQTCTASSAFTSLPETEHFRVAAAFCQTMGISGLNIYGSNYLFFAFPSL